MLTASFQVQVPRLEGNLSSYTRSLYSWITVLAFRPLQIGRPTYEFALLDAPTLQRLLDRGVDKSLAFRFDVNDFTPLKLATQYGLGEAVLGLLEPEYVPMDVDRGELDKRFKRSSMI